MGVTLDAYYIIDQKEAEEFVKTNNINVEDYDQQKIVAKYFYEKITGIKCEKYGPPVNYYYRKPGDRRFGYYDRDYYDEDDEDDEDNPPTRHFLVDWHACKYIRDHPLLNPNQSDDSNKLPLHLSNCCLYCIDTPDDAVRLATDLRNYYPEDEDLTYFADWLEHTAKYCYKYKYDM